jgi:hypothetical protein
MKTKWIKRTLVVLGLAPVVAVLGVVTAARLHDGPLDGALEIVAAGPFESGELHTGPEPDWSFLRDYATVQFQLLDPPRSRTTWIAEHQGRIFIVSGYMNTWYGKLWKHWPREAEADGRAILRVDGTLYERQMVRIREGDIVAPVLAELGRKYAGGVAIPVEEVTSGNIWMFELRPRA